MSLSQKLIWIVATVAVAALVYLAFRAYLSPAMLFEFANNFYC